MKYTPSSTARCRTRCAVARSFGSPHTPAPVRRMAPKPMRLTTNFPASAIVPEAAAGVALPGMLFPPRNELIHPTLQELLGVGVRNTDLCIEERIVHR